MISTKLDLVLRHSLHFDADPYDSYKYININPVTLIKGKFTYNSLFLRSLSSLAMNLFSLYSASSFRPPANTGIGGGSMIDMVFALLTLDEI